MKYVTYRPPKLVKTKARWYIEYYYRIPAELQEKYKSDWHRFRVFEDINRYKTDEYAAKLLGAVADMLESGYNPFDVVQREAAIKGDSEDVSRVTIKRGIELFLEKQGKKGLSDSMLRKYRQTCELLNTWFNNNHLSAAPINKIKQSHIENMLEWARAGDEDKAAWGNRQYNNIKGNCYTVFEFFKSKGWIMNNPVEKIESLKTTSKKHRYFDKKLFPKITKIIQANDPYLWQACQFIYYLAVRSQMELRLMKVGDIMDEGEIFLFKADATKGKREDAIPIDPNLKEVMKDMGLFSANPKHYIFTAEQVPGPLPAGINYFAKRFAKVRDLAGINSEYSLYSFRHTRATHLIKDGAKLSDVMRLFRHRDISTTAIYCRGLGIDFDSTELQQLTRKI